MCSLERVISDAWTQSQFNCDDWIRVLYSVAWTSCIKIFEEIVRPSQKVMCFSGEEYIMLHYIKNIL